MELTTGAYAEAPAKMKSLRLGNEQHCRPDSWTRAVRNHLCQSGGRSEQEVEARSLRRLDCADPMDQAVVGCGQLSRALARDDLDFAIDAVDDVEGPLVHLAL